MRFLKIAYKTLTIVLLFFTIIAGMLTDVPNLPVIGESVRVLFFHVGMWLAMIMMLTISMVFSIFFLRKQKPYADSIAHEAANVGLFFGILGIITGMIWARVTWGAWWISDPKLNGAAITLITYLAYKLLRASIKDENLRARTAAVYDIFAFIMMLVFIMILPRTSPSSLHPGQNSIPAFNPAEMATGLRWIFYPALCGWVLLSFWLLEIRVRFIKLKMFKKNFPK